MLREEAITILKAFMENPLFSEVHKAAFNIAIHDIKQRHDWDINNLILINKDNYEALEQEPIKGHCKDCKYFEYDTVAKIDGLRLIVAHEICSKWGDGCKTTENGYCFLFESKSEVEE